MHLEYDSEPNTYADPEPLSPPDFDDETTLLSARPVIPLAALDARSAWKRRIPVAVAIILLLVGVATVVELRQNRILAPVANSSQTLPDTSGSGSPADASSNDMQSGAESLTLQRGQAARLVQHSAQNSGLQTKNAGLTRKLIRPSPQRARDRLRPDAGSGERNMGYRHRDPVDGIFRVQDIFEGPSRP